MYHPPNTLVQAKGVDRCTNTLTRRQNRNLIPIPHYQGLKNPQNKQFPVNLL